MLLLSGSAGTARAAEGELVIMAVDSSRMPEPDGRSNRPAPRPVAEGVAEVVRKLEREGSIAGRQLRIVDENDQCEADEAVAIAARAIAQGVDVVIGHACASGAIRAAELYAAAGVLMIATGPRHPRLTSAGGRRSILRLAGRDDRQAESIASLIAGSFPAARVAIIHDRSLQGRGMAEELRRSAVAAQVLPVLVAMYAPGTMDHAALIAELTAARADLVIFPSQPFEASIILDQASRAGTRIATAIGTDVLAAEPPPARLLAAVDTYLVMLPWPGSGPEVTGEEVGRDLAAAAMEAWTAALVDAGDRSPERVAAALRDKAHATRLGPVRFDEKGDAVVPSYVPHAWRAGRWQAWK